MKSIDYKNSDLPYKKLVKYIMKDALDITGATEVLVTYGTDSSLKMHLSLKKWDRVAVYDTSGKGFFGYIRAKLKKVVVRIRKLFPVPNFITVDGKVTENYGVIPYLMNRCNFFYKKGITVVFVHGLKKVLEKTDKKSVTVPIYSFDGFAISELKENLKLLAQILKATKSYNMLCLHIPHFGLMVLTNLNSNLFIPENESEFITKCSSLVNVVNTASLTYYKQKAQFINEAQRNEELLEKEEMLRVMGENLRQKEKELEYKTQTLNQVAKEKYQLELQRDHLSQEVLNARKAIKEIQLETDSNLATIAHTSKNLYMAQKSFTNFVKEDIGSIDVELEQIQKYMSTVDIKYKKLNNYRFWKVIKNNMKNLKLAQKTLVFNNVRSTNHMFQIMEYILSVLAYQRGKDYTAEGKYSADLMKVLKHINNTHKERLEGLGIDFKYTNKTAERKVLLGNIYHFHLEEDIFINLLINSIQALSNTPDKKIWVEIYSEKGIDGNEYYEAHYRDNGPGIPADKKEAIFKGWSSKEGGLKGSIEDKTERGVGGQTIYKRVHNAGGSIKEIGVEGSGAHFILKFEKFKEEAFEEDLNIEVEDTGIENEIEKVLPKIPEPAIAPPPAIHDDMAEVTGKTILIIDDDARIQNYIAGIFKNVLIPSFATGYDEAWDQIYGPSPPELITLDLDLEGLEKGENLLFDFNMKGVTREIPIIVVSGADRALERDKLKKLGAAEVFPKPVKDEQLRKAVFRLLRKKNSY